ncbi:hypothetical protein QW060_20090 [Myroides ceti]|uniref:Uncharacterized protein n=1 Tax=Paenimyroides ceti TaxID=395087 RepID=A0ABT8CWQ6_9FLAO|nr:hypothetical protein [Paenimyroides ceti]MDN3707602.1 hypothetical protein [Paenimyroides ceti]MDN3709320.1 hypothetical protein [Paenimyroides ceti]
MYNKIDIIFTMKELDLYSEAKPRYYQLIPNREDGLILLALYQKNYTLNNCSNLLKE